MQRFYSVPVARLPLFLPMSCQFQEPGLVPHIYLGSSRLCLLSSLYFWRILHNTFLSFCLLQKIIILLILVKSYIPSITRSTIPASVQSCVYNIFNELCLCWSKPGTLGRRMHRWDGMGWFYPGVNQTRSYGSHCCQYTAYHKCTVELVKNS